MYRLALTVLVAALLALSNRIAPAEVVTYPGREGPGRLR